MINFIARLNHYDRVAFLWLHVVIRVPLWRFARWVSRSGDGGLYVLFALLAWWLDVVQGSKFVLAVAGCFIIERTLYWLLKNSIRRDRPAVGIASFKAFVVPSDQFSFPSGHTAAAFMFALLVLQYYPAFAPVCYIWAMLIGISRVLLGVHYPTDIVAGALLGSTSALIGLWLMAGFVAG